MTDNYKLLKCCECYSTHDLVDCMGDLVCDSCLNNQELEENEALTDAERNK